MIIHFILSHPAVPENVGFACRAINAMGFGKLRLVNPCDHLSQPAKKTAYGSHAVLESALVYPNLQAAVADMDLVVGTSAKKRPARHEYYSAEELTALLQEKEGVLSNLGIVFGSERDGLSKEEIELCDVLSSIPLAAPYPSLNLAQSVLIYAYELSKSRLHLSDDKVPAPYQAELKQKTLDILTGLEITRQPSLYHRLKDRILAANTDDTKLMLSFARFLTRRLKQY